LLHEDKTGKPKGELQMKNAIYCIT